MLRAQRKAPSKLPPLPRWCHDGAIKADIQLREPLTGLVTAELGYKQQTHSSSSERAFCRTQHKRVPDPYQRKAPQPPADNTGTWPADTRHNVLFPRNAHSPRAVSRLEAERPGARSGSDWGTAGAPRQPSRVQAAPRPQQRSRGRAPARAHGDCRIGHRKQGMGSAEIVNRQLHTNKVDCPVLIAGKNNTKEGQKKKQCCANR